MNKPAPEPQRPPMTGNIPVELGEAEAQGIYSNLAFISHSASEVVVDFARALPGVPKARVYARIILTPYHAKALHRALGENLKKFEAQHGEIKIGGGTDGGSKSIGF